MKTFGYSTAKYPIRELIKTALGVSSLSLIHKDEKFIYNNKFKRKIDQSTHYHKLFYELARTKEFSVLYREFLLDCVKPIFQEEIVFQKIPTFRIHFPGNIAVGEYHRDRDYRDSDWAKDVKEKNFFLPITDAFDTNTIWVESEEGKEDFQPMIKEYGQFVMWDGLNLKHGNKTNKETLSRISFDFRVMPFSNYKPSDLGSINTNTKFSLGGYYDKL